MTRQQGFLPKYQKLNVMFQSKNKMTGGLEGNVITGQVNFSISLTIEPVAVRSGDGGAIIVPAFGP